LAAFEGVVDDDEDEDDDEELVDDDEDELVVDDDELEAVPTTIVTVEPFVRCEPPDGDCVSTVPTLDASVTDRVFTNGTSPAARIADSACEVVSPVIEGTDAFAGAWAITIVTPEPEVADAPALGSWLSTVPAGAESVTCDVVLATKPASVSV
jgi:hypothetical protein